MDPEPTEFDLTQLFDLAPDTFAWRAPVPRQIEQRRADMTDVLIFDILLSAGGIKHPDSLYPPRDEQSLRDLLDAIEETTYDGLKKDCLIYFLLKWQKDGREDRFQEDRCIPPQFVALADAYWLLDSGEDVPRAISLLSDARLNRDYTSKILQAIALEKEDANALVLQYIRTAKPLLTEPDDIDAYSIALAESNLFEAWQYQRTFSEDEEIRPRVFRNILRWCLSPKPRAMPLTQLLSFPLSNYEQSQLHDFALRPPSNLPASSIPVIQDLACVRLIHSGQLAAAVKLDRQFAITPIRGAFGGRVSEQAKRAAHERKQTMEEIMSVMPSAERQLLELELEQMSQSADTPTFLNGNVTDLSMSWEHVRPPPTNSASSSSQKPISVKPAYRTDSVVPPIPQKSGAPRFGGPVPRKPSASSAFTAVRDMFDSISKQSPSRPQASEATPIVSPNGAQAGGSHLPSGSSLPAAKANLKRKEATSLFDSVGSANKAPNAFFQPPPTSASTKRPPPEEPTFERPAIYRADMSTESAFDVSAMLNEPADVDVDMHNSDVEVETEKKLLASGRKPTEEASPEFAVSVFEPNESRRSVGPTDTSITKTVPESVPGAFNQASEDESDHDETSSGKMLLEELELPPRPAPKTSAPSSSRRARAPPLTKEPSLSHSVPGAFIADEDDEEEDVVPPLPPVTPARRQTRKTRTTKHDEDLHREPPARTTRRSSRLSVMSASSVGSSSPEPPEPEKRTRPKATRQAAATSRIPRSKRQR